MALTQYREGRKGAPSDLFIATTSGSGQPHGNYVASLADTMAALKERGLEADYYLHSWDCHVDDARNAMVRLFLESGCPVMVFIDDDVGWVAEDLIKLIQYDEDIVAGAYPLKQDNEDYPVRLFGGEQRARPNGLLKVEGAPTGFMAIKRHVVEAVSEAKKWTEFKARNTRDGDSRHRIVFERTLEDGHRWSGDYAFCRFAQKLGFEVFVDPEMRFSHEGVKRWTGCFGDYLRKTQGIFNPYLDKALRRLAAGETSAEVFSEIFGHSGNPYAAGPMMIAAAYNLAKQTRGDILETGSGLTTIAMGMAAMKNGATIHTLEHSPDWFAQTRNMIQRFGLKSVRLYYVPLKEQPDGGWWYEIAPELPEKFDLAIVDGPPRRYGRENLYGLMADRVADATWIVDDVDYTADEERLKELAPGREIEVFGSNEGSGGRRFAIVRRATDSASQEG